MLPFGFPGGSFFMRPSMKTRLFVDETHFVRSVHENGPFNGRESKIYGFSLVHFSTLLKYVVNDFRSELFCFLNLAKQYNIATYEN